MSELTQAVKASFTQVLNYQPSHIIQAPGRVNLIGDCLLYTSDAADDC